ncbi:MAG: hypothetical protein ACJ76L_11225 [Conexibacter sp.]
MEGGIAILLILMIVVVVGGIAFALSGTGGFLWWRKTDPHGDRVEGSDEGEGRPQHLRPTTPAQEHTDFVGGDEATRGA